MQGVALPSGYASHAQWLAAFQATNLAARSQGLFSGGQALFANLAGSVPQGVTRARLQELGARYGMTPAEAGAPKSIRLTGP